MSTLTLQDAKAHLNIDVVTYDAELQATIDEAESLISQEIGPLASTTKTSQVDGGGYSLLLPSTPVVSLTSVVANTGDVISVSDLTVLNPGVVQYTTGGACFPAAWYTVVYQTGRSTVPDGLLRGIKDMTDHLWKSQRGPSRRPGAGQQQETGPGGLFPPEVLEAIRSYRQAGFA